ncbi:hypothetical protein JXB41_09165 [Candidatus Woesearchaeota archaeon]|nr:hypothetical protein [Candidatus Woesearchaeota archaeon]
MPRLTRRFFLKLGALTVASLPLLACVPAGLVSPTPKPIATPVPDEDAVLEAIYGSEAEIYGLDRIPSVSLESIVQNGNSTLDRISNLYDLLQGTSEAPSVRPLSDLSLDEKEDLFKRVLNIDSDAELGYQLTSQQVKRYLFREYTAHLKRLYWLEQRLSEKGLSEHKLRRIKLGAAFEYACQLSIGESIAVFERSLGRNLQAGLVYKDLNQRLLNAYVSDEITVPKYDYYLEVINKESKTPPNPSGMINKEMGDSLSTLISTTAVRVKTQQIPDEPAEIGNLATEMTRAHENFLREIDAFDLTHQLLYYIYDEELRAQYTVGERGKPWYLNMWEWVEELFGSSGETFQDFLAKKDPNFFIWLTETRNKWFQEQGGEVEAYNNYLRFNGLSSSKLSQADFEANIVNKLVLESIIADLPNRFSKGDKKGTPEKGALLRGRFNIKGATKTISEAMLTKYYRQQLTQVQNLLFDREGDFLTMKPLVQERLRECYEEMKRDRRFDPLVAKGILPEDFTVDRLLELTADYCVALSKLGEFSITDHNEVIVHSDVSAFAGRIADSMQWHGNLLEIELIGPIGYNGTVYNNARIVQKRDGSAVLYADETKSQSQFLCNIDILFSKAKRKSDGTLDKFGEGAENWGIKYESDESAINLLQTHNGNMELGKLIFRDNFGNYLNFSPSKAKAWKTNALCIQKKPSDLEIDLSGREAVELDILEGMLDGPADIYSFVRFATYSFKERDGSLTPKTGIIVWNKNEKTPSMYFIYDKNKRIKLDEIDSTDSDFGPEIYANSGLYSADMSELKESFHCMIGPRAVKAGSGEIWAERVDAPLQQATFESQMLLNNMKTHFGGRPEVIEIYNIDGVAQKPLREDIQVYALSNAFAEHTGGFFSKIINYQGKIATPLPFKIDSEQAFNILGGYFPGARTIRDAYGEEYYVLADISQSPALLPFTADKYSLIFRENDANVVYAVKKEQVDKFTNVNKIEEVLGTGLTRDAISIVAYLFTYALIGLLPPYIGSTGKAALGFVRTFGVNTGWADIFALGLYEGISKELVTYHGR